MSYFLGLHRDPAKDCPTAARLQRHCPGATAVQPAVQCRQQAAPDSAVAARVSIDYRKSTLARGSRWDYKPLPF